MFSIGFTDEAFEKVEPEEQGRMGLLVLGSHHERFVTHFWAWSEKEYQDQWTNGLTRVLRGLPSALITDMRTPTQSSHLVWWPMWRVNHKIVFHNQLFFFEQHGLRTPQIETELLYEFIGERSRKSADGTPLSEWVVALPHIEKFLETRGHV